MYWIYGLPRIGKTTLAHSICAALYKQEQLAGAFFCQRDDPDLNEPKISSRLSSTNSRSSLPSFEALLQNVFVIIRT